jgi:hypothetical protein
MTCCLLLASLNCVSCGFGLEQGDTPYSSDYSGVSSGRGGSQAAAEPRAQMPELTLDGALSRQKSARKVSCQLRSDEAPLSGGTKARQPRLSCGAIGQLWLR